MDRARILEVVRNEFHKHRFDFYQESVPGSRRPITVPGCTICKMRVNTMSQFVDHLEEKVAAAVERELSRSSNTENAACRFPVAINRIPLPSR